MTKNQSGHSGVSPMDRTGPLGLLLLESDGKRQKGRGHTLRTQNHAWYLMCTQDIVERAN